MQVNFVFHFYLLLSYLRGLEDGVYYRRAAVRGARHSVGLTALHTLQRTTRKYSQETRLSLCIA